MPDPVTGSLRRAAVRLAVRLPRRTVRLRLTLLYGALFLVCGAALLTIAYVLVAHLPVTTQTHITTGPGSVVPGRGPSSPLPELDSPASQADRQRSADLYRLLVASATALAIMSVISVGLGWVMAGRVLRPLRTITATTRRISASNLNQRLALTGPADELTVLGDTIDALLARLERSFTSQRQFVANASHELRTPLTLQRALLEAALTDPDPTIASWHTAGERALAAGVQQERLIDALLTLARSEAGLDRRQTFDLAAITQRALTTWRREAEHRGLRVTATLDPTPVTGDARLVERLVANLIANAVRHNIDGGWVEVRTEVSNGRAALSVANSGPVIPAADVARLFQPFQRLAQERTRQNDGLGLGLSIVRAIADAHDAHVEARPHPDGGLEITVTFR
jgi:signal transduction histidine kinase